MPVITRSKSQKKNGGSRSLRRSRSAKRGGRRATKSSRGGQRAKKSVMQRGGGVITWKKLGPYLKNKGVLNSFYVPFQITPETDWETALEPTIKNAITDFNWDSVDVPALLTQYKNNTAPYSNKYVISALTELQTELQKPEQNPEFV